MLAGGGRLGEENSAYGGRRCCRNGVGQGCAPDYGMLDVGGCARREACGKEGDDLDWMRSHDHAAEEKVRTPGVRGVSARRSP